MKSRPLCAAILAAVVLLCVNAVAQQQPNTNATYRMLRNLLPGGASVSVQNLTIKRDAATFTFAQGDFAFYGEINGKVTGAVFGGHGHMHLTAPTAVERHNLEVLTKKPEYEQDFTTLVLRFTDGTAEEIRKSSSAKPAGSAESSTLVQAAMELHTFQRQREHQFENIDLRILEDVLSTAPGGFFLAEMRGAGDQRIIFEIDPHGAPEVTPEEVRLSVWNQWGWSFPAAFHLDGEYADGTASGRQQNATFTVDSEELETSIEKSGFLSATATVHLRAAVDGVVVLPFRLFPTLRVNKVESDKGDVLDFVQERKEEDADFGLVLAHALKKGEAATVRISYAGKDAVHDAGSNNFDPVARESWFPNGGTGFGNYSTYKMIFHVPKEDQLIATGKKISESVDGKVRTSEWDTTIPLPVVGFHLGQFAEKDDKTPDGLAVAAYANENLPDWADRFREMGGISTKGMLPVILSEGTVAVQIYEQYFGKLSFDHLALTQQPACNYGQSWPMLVYLPICGLWDSTVQHMLGLDAANQYWKVVTAHEVAHQWWGHTVGFQSYRDQWMSEGFAQTSAAIFLQSTRKNSNDFREFWKQLKTQITDKNPDGFRPIDVGPVTMGFRLSSPKTGWDIYQNLVYPKGAYILHMVRMMMWTPKGGDDQFRLMMHAFVDTYRLKPATTEDFKAMVEKYMTPQMDLDHNHKMDWFFNEYVYGTDLPHYHFESEIKSNSDAVAMHYKLTQSGVPDSFKMSVPIYVELADGRTLRIGSLSIQGNTTIEDSTPLPRPPSPIKRVMIDYMHDVLGIEN